uniref:Uncharacterized protein n=1 Tax=Nelumbo nucifera TaxID=4432 RepID=A0A822XRV1_NELNU|nr:TPA_asm: hypothetical protein HUJ06_023159 [Nelumbo nucifera]
MIYLNLLDTNITKKNKETGRNHKRGEGSFNSSPSDSIGFEGFPFPFFPFIFYDDVSQYS